MTARWRTDRYWGRRKESITTWRDYGALRWWYVTDGLFRIQRGKDSGLVGSQSDLHKSVHQFGIDCFAHNRTNDSIRFRQFDSNTVYLGKVSKWINFSILGGGFRFSYCCWLLSSANDGCCPCGPPDCCVLLRGSSLLLRHQ